MSGTKSGQGGRWNFNVFCLLTEELMLVKHIRSSVWFCKSFLLLFFPCICRRRGTGGWGSVLSTMAGRVTRLHQLFTVRHVLSNKGTVETGRGDGSLTHFTDLVLKQYFTNDLLNLNVHHHWSKMRKLDLLEPQSFLRRWGQKEENIDLNVSIINQIQ